jgi:hypothetical protein
MSQPSEIRCMFVLLRIDIDSRFCSTGPGCKTMYSVIPETFGPCMLTVVRP